MINASSNINHHNGGKTKAIAKTKINGIPRWWAMYSLRNHAIIAVRTIRTSKITINSVVFILL